MLTIYVYIAHVIHSTNIYGKGCVWHILFNALRTVRHQRAAWMRVASELMMVMRVSLCVYIYFLVSINVCYLLQWRPSADQYSSSVLSLFPFHQFKSKTIEFNINWKWSAKRKKEKIRLCEKERGGGLKKELRSEKTRKQMDAYAHTHVKTNGRTKTDGRKHIV